ncbi:MAG: SapC family protein [Arhodomonas sp.]|nr:SapC family protein [Arhodomonas sp.]
MRTASCENDGRWRAGVYMPAFVRRYPFILMENPRARVSGLALMTPASSFPGAREALFDAEGQYTETLQGYIRLMQEFYQDMQRTRAFTQRLVELDLLVERAVSVTAPDGETRRIGGVKLVEEQRLADVPDSDIIALQRDGYLGRLYARSGLAGQRAPAGDVISPFSVVSANAACQDQALRL